MSARAGTVVYVGTSIDGFIARPDGGIDWLEQGPPLPGEDYGWAEFHASIDGMIMGRATYEKALSFDTWIYGSLPITVLSTTLKSAKNVEVSALAPLNLLEQLGSQGKKRIYVDGGKTVQSFLREDLIDELVITRVTVLIGQGLPLFGPLQKDLKWQHVSTRTFPDGLVKTHYRRAR
jgi:dihydrofolate reductase